MAALFSWSPPALAHAGSSLAPAEGADEGSALVAKGDAAMDAGDVEKAITLYREAQSKGADVKAKLAPALFDHGQILYGKGEYQAALERFQDAQGLFPSAAFQYNIGTCYEALANYEQAVIHYKAYLRGVPNAPDRVPVMDKIKRLEALAAAEDRGETTQAPPPEPLKTESTQPQDGGVDQPEKKPGSALIITGAALTAVGLGVGLGGGLGFGMVALDRADQVDEVNQGGNPQGLTLSEAETLEQEGQQAQTLQITMIAVGAAVGITGVALLAVGLSKKAKASKVAAVPAFGPRFAGIGLSGRF